MKKRVVSCAAACGLLFLGAATWPQDPVAGDSAIRQAAPPSFRDVLRGKVGQECQVGSLHGVWVLQFSSAAGGEAGERKEPDPAPAIVPSSGDLRQMLRANGVEAESRTVGAIRNEALERITREFVDGYIAGNVALVKPMDVLTVVAVGADFVQLRSEDGTERFIPLSRVDVVVRAGRQSGRQQ